ncbi:3-keto-5-aminohexanoate cleavage protein [Microbacterium sp. BWT-B31]|uniref:3-keto-5-aminohexanoate cleavage protein n=1 Tax=Microbacterium sp. BWT-B31 TaxID=3232072 RepID=UPI00352881B2
MTGLFITVAPTGAESTKAHNPGIPLQPDEIVAQAVACEAAGAGLIHIHGRDPAGESTLDLAVLREIVDGVREQTDLVVQLSTGGSVRDGFDARRRVLELQPESCSLTCGTVNFGTEVFHNPLSFIEELYLETIARGIVPEFECFDLGHVTTLNRLLDTHGAPATGVVHCNLVMGVPGGMAGDARTMIAALGALPAGASWSATGIGRAHVPVMLAALAMGGSLRVGMEDVLRFSASELVRDNAQLVERAAQLAALAQADILTPDEVRVRLGLG